MTRIMAIDPSTTSMGWACDGDYGALKVGAKLPRGHRLMEMHRHLGALVRKYHPDFIIYYRPFSRGADATRCGWGIAAVIEMVACAENAACDDIAESTVRSELGIKAPKELKSGECREWLKQKALDKCAEFSYLGIKDDDEADAILLHIYATANLKVSK